MKIWNTPEVETLNIESTACHDEIPTTPVCEQASGAAEVVVPEVPCNPVPQAPCNPWKPGKRKGWH